MNSQYLTQLLDFLAASPTAFHAADRAARLLTEAGFTEVFEEDGAFFTRPGSYFVRRNDSALIAFTVPETGFDRFIITASHADSPCFRLKRKAASPAAGVYTVLAGEKYGGMILSSWTDRPLSVAGRVMVRSGERIVSRLVNIDRDLLLIPNVAPHMDREAADGKKYSVLTDMLPVLSGTADADFDALLAEELQVSKEDILDADLFVYSRSPASVWGLSQEFVSSARLDDLQCAFGCLQGLIQAKPLRTAAVYCLFNNEEVGSLTLQGAASDLLSAALRNITECCGMSAAEHRGILARSYLVSADNAHAVHPAHPELADAKDRPVINGGIVIKSSASQSYTSDALSSVVLEEVCRTARVPFQRFTNRADIRGGSTLGSISLGQVSVHSVDIGLAQLAMHSAYETAGVLDTDYLVQAMQALYSAEITFSRGCVEVHV